MQTHPKKRIELIIEAPALNRLLDLLDKAEVAGYTVLPVLAGRGRQGRWSRDGLVGVAGQMLMVVCVTSEHRVDALMAAISKFLARQIGIVTVSDCQVLRTEHF